MKKKIFFVFLGIVVLLGIAYRLYADSLTQTTYQGLPTVPCLDYTKPIVNRFSFFLSITILGTSFPLDSTIGHGYGNCLYDIHTDDLSGKVIVETNEKEQFTLGQFFDVWHKTFTNTQLGNYITENENNIQVLVNGQNVSTFRYTPLLPNEHIAIICK